MNFDKKSQDNNGPASTEDYYKIVKPLKTYERDVSELLREGGASKSGIRLEEQKKRLREIKSDRIKNKEEIFETNSLSFKKITIALIVLIFSVGSILIITKIFSSDYSEELATKPTLKTEILIKGDIVRDLDVTGKNRNEILEEVKNQISKVPKKNDQIVIIYPVEFENETETSLNAEQFLTKINTQLSGYLLRAIGPEMAFGYYTKNDELTPFLLLEINSKNNAFAGMLEWEKNMLADLSGFITNNSSSVMAQFEDHILKQRDLRVLRDSSGDFVLLYSFLDDETLLITGDVETFTKISDKYF